MYNKMKTGALAFVCAALVLCAGCSAAENSSSAEATPSPTAAPTATAEPTATPVPELKVVGEKSDSKDTFCVTLENGTKQEITAVSVKTGSEEKFQTHFDSINEVCDRYLVFLWYLNDVEAGGETWFPGLHTGVAPRTGRLLMFPPYWMYAHQGKASPAQDKYILSTYLRFPQRQSSV